jgi:hypothetical protein
MRSTTVLGVIRSAKASAMMRPAFCATSSPTSS